MPAPTTLCPYSADASAAIARLADLPPPVTARVVPMAEAGAPFQATDALEAGARPPSRRFVRAEGRGCALAVTYEQGGFAHRWRTARFVWRGGAWSPAGAPAPSR